MKVWPGNPYPMGATFDGIGTNFSVFSESAERIELCLFDKDGVETRLNLPEQTGFCWHGYLPDVQPGQQYGFRAHGPWDPPNGHRFSPAKLLLDPYAKATASNLKWDDALFSCRPEEADGGSHGPDERDSAPFMPRCVVINPYFDWSKERRPNVPLRDTIIYELHVKGFTVLNGDVPGELRGTYAGLGHPAAVEYLGKLGVTAVELMPVHQFVHDRQLVARGLRNYWGYNTIGYFTPHNEYSSCANTGQEVQEFKQMVLRLHEAGIEVILDVVYNHTAEGNHKGPTLSFKGLDNASYYLLEKDRRYYTDFTGCGNTLNMANPQVVQMVMDSLRYWITEMHVDGFRFDLAAAMARGMYSMDSLATFFAILHQDPIIGQAKLIAEPWDVGAGGYQVGRFPPRWSEWNGKYRDAVRDFWRGSPIRVHEFVTRLLGSPDLYEATGRRPYGSINFVVAHDGFTLRDLVTYQSKHNEANGEDNRDGLDDNRSCNNGVEGETDDAGINELRRRQQRNMLTTLLLSQGIPLVLAGSESGRTQRGNNNAYCQDNETSWLAWEKTDARLAAFVRELVRLRREHPVFHTWKRLDVARGKLDPLMTCCDIDGKVMSNEEWSNDVGRPFMVRLSGKINQIDRLGEPIADADFCLLFNPTDQQAAFTAPAGDGGQEWGKELDTAEEAAQPSKQTFAPGQAINVAARSMVVLSNVAKPAGDKPGAGG
ncbi:MAG: glycogen debranching protein GlgX [Phycisphaerae bacterium]